MKIAICLILSLLIFSTPILAQELENPCGDKIFLNIKEKKIDEMSEREY